MWTELLATLPDQVVVTPPAPETAFEEASCLLGQPLPAELVSVLRESNGVEGEYGLGLIWPIARIVAENLALRSDVEMASRFMPFDSLLFFGDAGNGDLFAVVPHTSRPDVYAWNHMDDSRTWVAPGLATYLEWWLTGRIQL